MVPSGLDLARLLDLHYIPSRYPNGLPDGYPHQFYGKKTAEDSCAAAEGIFAAVRHRLAAAGAEDVIRPEEE